MEMLVMMLIPETHNKVRRWTKIGSSHYFAAPAHTRNIYYGPTPVLPGKYTEYCDVVTIMLQRRNGRTIAGLEAIMR